MKLLILLTILLLPFSLATKPASNTLKKNTAKQPSSIDNVWQTAGHNVSTLIPVVATGCGLYGVTYATCRLLTWFGLADGRNCHPYAVVSVSVPTTVWSSFQAYSIWAAENASPSSDFVHEKDLSREL